MKLNLKKSKKKRQYLIELDGVLYNCSGNEISLLADVKEIIGEKWFVTDMSEAVSRVMTVETEPKYSEVMIRKSLQETGEFDEPLHVISHWKKKREGGRSDNFFTAMPSRLYNRYSEQVIEDDDVLLVFPLSSVLLRIIRKMGSENPVGVIFRHGRFADVLIADTKQIFFANRCAAFELTDDQIEALWGMIQADIMATELEHRIKIEKLLVLNWLDSENEPGWMDGMVESEVIISSGDVFYEGEKRSCSFIEALTPITPKDSISKPLGKIFYYSRKAVPFLNVIFLLISLALAGGAYSFGKKSEKLANEINILEKVKTSLEHIEPLKEVKYENTLKFIRKLDYYDRINSFKKTLDDVSESLLPGMYIETLKINHAKGEMRLNASGRVKADFDTAHKGYQAFLKQLKKKGYSVVDSSFNTEIQQANFLLKLVKKAS